MVADISLLAKIDADRNSPFTPYCGLKLCELAQNYFPPAVFQCLSGNDDLGPLLTQHEDVNKISFTGSIETGRSVMRSCSQTLKRMTLELSVRWQYLSMLDG